MDMSFMSNYHFYHFQLSPQMKNKLNFLEVLIKVLKEVLVHHHHHLQKIIIIQTNRMNWRKEK